MDGVDFLRAFSLGCREMSIAGAHRGRKLSGKAFWERAAGNRIWQVMRKQGRKRNGFWRMACPPRRKSENDFAIV